MNRFSPLLSQWHGQVKQLFTLLHGHQKKVLALFVLGAMRAESIVLARVAEELLTETEAKVPSIERRLQRDFRNERVQVEPVWEQFLAQVLPFWRGKEVTLVLDITPFEEHAQVIYGGCCSRHGFCRKALESHAGPARMGAGPVGNRGALV
jgi:hypothetical protein